MTDAKPRVTERRRISPIWIVPVVALLLGFWMLIYTYQNQGPKIEIEFPTASGIEPGKTKVKVLDVVVGLVESVGLGEDLKSIVVKARLDKETEPLLREDTEFWVVTARLGTSGVSGISTLLSGGYIQLSPGNAPGRRSSFVGLAEPPVTPAGTPGLKIELIGDKAGSVSAGDPILHKGFRVGRIESARFDVETGKMQYSVFIEENYQQLINSSTRFWNTSGISFNATADGIQIETGSLLTLLIGGVSFGAPTGVPAGEPVSNGASFDLYPDHASMNRHPYRVGLEYIVRFDQSIRGLKAGAPVDYRGLRIGRVEDILINELSISGAGEPIPVLITIQPGRMLLPDNKAGAAQMRKAIKNSVALGMHASLATGSLITGSKYIALDIHEREAGSALGSYAGRQTIPTLPAGLEGLEYQVSNLLAKLNDLPLEQLASSASDAIGSADRLLASESMQELPVALEATLANVRQTLDSISGDSALQGQLLAALVGLDHSLESIRELAITLNEQPNSLIFAHRVSPDLIPPAGNQ
jgi:paraquat-inducible protein B